MLYKMFTLSNGIVKPYALNKSSQKADSNVNIIVVDDFKLLGNKLFILYIHKICHSGGIFSCEIFNPI